MPTELNEDNASITDTSPQDMSELIAQKLASILPLLLAAGYCLGFVVISGRLSSSPLPLGSLLSVDYLFAGFGFLGFIALSYVLVWKKVLGTQYLGLIVSKVAAIEGMGRLKKKLLIVMIWTNIVPSIIVAGIIFGLVFYEPTNESWRVFVPSIVWMILSASILSRAKLITSLGTVAILAITVVNLCLFCWGAIVLSEHPPQGLVLLFQVLGCGMLRVMYEKDATERLRMMSYDATYACVMAILCGFLFGRYCLDGNRFGFYDNLYEDAYVTLDTSRNKLPFAGMAKFEKGMKVRVYGEANGYHYIEIPSGLEGQKGDLLKIQKELVLVIDPIEELQTGADKSIDARANGT